MLMAELKERWGAYCDTDKLVTDMMALLTKYKHDNTELGVCNILDTYFTNKKHLIEMFKTSEHYVGNMRICVDVELQRNSNAYEVRKFCEDFPHNVGARDHFIKYVDENGKSLKDYSRTGVKKLKARNLCYGNLRETIAANSDNRKKFNFDGSTKASAEDYDRFWNMIYGFKDSHGSTLSRHTVNILTQYNINGRFAEGMKTSRAFNRVCSIHGVDKLPAYNKMFAEYADMVSGLKRNMKFYISVNPLDYLTMSFGNSWSSCHTIDKENSRRMANGYQGMHCGGTMSYMLDATSIITYVHNHATEDHEEGKVYRNMFHFDGGTLIQGRVYPQGNDGATDLYKTFRGFMQDEMAKLLKLTDNNWVKKSGGCYDNTVSYGVHYRDYEHFEDCCVTYPKEMPNASNHTVVIGHSRICPQCGYEVSDDDDCAYLDHENCEDAAEEREYDTW